MKAHTPTSSVRRKWPSVFCAPSMAPSSLERPSPIGSSIEPEMSMTSSTDDGLRICVHWSMAADTTSTGGFGSVTAGFAGSTPYSSVKSLPSGTDSSSGRKPYSGRISCASCVCTKAANASPASRCSAVTQSAPSTVIGLSDHIEPPAGYTATSFSFGGVSVSPGWTVCESGLPWL